MERRATIQGLFIAYSYAVLFLLLPPSIAYYSYIFLRLLRFMKKLFPIVIAASVPLVSAFVSMSSWADGSSTSTNTSSDSSAQVSSNKNSARNTVFITGGRTEVPTVNRPSTYTFTQADIEKTTAEDLTQLLSQVPGFSFDHNGGRGASAGINIRGAESDHTLILIDGVRTASASSGTTAMQHISLSQIERIEVIKGPKSGVYGADALGGVIQIFTKKGKNNFGGYAEIGAGSHDSDSLAVGFNGGNDDIYYGINANKYETDGIDRKLNSTGVDVDQDSYDQESVSVNLGRDSLNGLDIDFIASLNRGNTQFDSGNVDDSTDFRTENVSLNTVYPISSSVDMHFQLGYFKDDQETFGRNTSRFITRRNSLTHYINYRIDSKQSLVLGYDYYDDKVASTSNFIQPSRDNEALFTEYALSNDAINLQVSLREDDNQSYGNKTSGSLLIGTSINNSQQVSLSYGTAFKAPTFNDLFFPFTDFGGGFTYQGNPNLKPESSKTVELAYAGQFSNMGIDVSIYRTTVDNLIQGTATFDTVENISNVELIGGEFAIRQQLSSFDWGIALSHVDARNTANEERLNRRPRGSLQAYANKPIGQLDLSVHWRAESNRRQSATRTTGGYGLLDLGAQYRFAKKHALKFLTKNIFDKEYVLISSSTSTFNTEGRTFEVKYHYLF